MVVSQLGLIIEKQQTEESIPVPSPFKPSLVGNAQTDSFPDLVQKKILRQDVLSYANTLSSD